MKSRYEQTPVGLQQYVLDLLDRYKRKRTQIQLKNIYVQHKMMRQTHSGLVRMQHELNAIEGSVVSVKRGITRSVYKLKEQ